MRQLFFGKVARRHAGKVACRHAAQPRVGMIGAAPLAVSCASAHRTACRPAAVVPCSGALLPRMWLAIFTNII